MKLKHSFIVIGLVAMLGLGVGVGLSNKTSQRADALNGNPPWYVVGTIGGANHWSTATGYQMTEVSGASGTYSVEVTLQKNDKFKTWDGTDENYWQGKTNFDNGSSSSKVSAYFGTDGDGNIVYNDNTTRNFRVIFTPSGSWPITVEEVHTYGLVGSGAGLSWDKDVAFTRQANRTYTLSKHLSTGDSIKVRADGAWTIEFGFNSFSSASTHFSGSDNNNLTVKEGASGTYTFTIAAGSDTNHAASVISYSLVPDVSNGNYLRGDWGEDNYGWSDAGQIEMSEVSAGVVRATGVLLPAGGKVKMVTFTDGVIAWGNVSGVPTYNVGYPVTVDEGDCKVTNTGTYTITCTYVSEDNGNKLWSYNFEGSPNPNLEAAIAFAESFVSGLYAECPYNYGTSSYNAGKSASTVATKWSELKGAYETLIASTPGAEAYLKTTGGTVSQITTMWASYDYVYGHYAEVRAINGADFLTRTPAVAPLNPAIASFAEEQSNTTLVIAIVAASTVTLLALGGYFYFRKRKEDR